MVGLLHHDEDRPINTMRRLQESLTFLVADCAQRDAHLRCKQAMAHVLFLCVATKFDLE